MNHMYPVIHFEMPADDRQRMAAFYENVFGWRTQMLGPEMGEYVLVTTTESDERGPKKPGAINGGFYQRMTPEDCPSVVIQVDDIQSHIKKVQDAGGKMGCDPFDIPGVGTYAWFTDTEGNRLSMLQPFKNENK